MSIRDDRSSRMKCNGKQAVGLSVAMLDMTLKVE